MYRDLILGMGLIAAAMGNWAQEQKGEKRDATRMTYLREGGFPLNVNPEIISAAEAEIGVADLVMGVVVNGVARAYPVNYMNGPWNEVVNDRIGDTDIAPSW